MITIDITEAVNKYIKDGSIDPDLQKEAFRVAAIHYNNLINDLDNQLRVLFDDTVDFPRVVTPASYHADQMKELMRTRSHYVQLRLYYQALYESDKLITSS